MKAAKSLEKEIPMQTMEVNETTNDPENLLSLICLELIDENIDRFVGIVEHDYQSMRHKRNVSINPSNDTGQ
jgi:hypothetical protein